MNTFDYYGLPGIQQNQPMQTQQQPAQQQSGQQISPLSGLNAYQQFAGGSGSTGGSAAASSTGGAGGSAGSSLASAGPWAALAAVIIGNEREGIRQGYRDEDPEEYAKDLIGGKVLEQDFNKRWIPKVFGDDDYGFGGDAGIAAELSTGDFSNAWDKFKDESTLAKAIKKIF